MSSLLSSFSASFGGGLVSFVTFPFVDKPSSFGEFFVDSTKMSDESFDDVHFSSF